jgi:hypothetical protein
MRSVAILLNHILPIGSFAELRFCEECFPEAIPTMIMFCIFV